MKLYGRNPILERLKANPKSIQKILLEENHRDEGLIRHKAREFKIPIISVAPARMSKMTHHTNAQGVLAEVEDFAYAEYEGLVEQALKTKQTLLFLDNLNDPQNLGAIIRSAAALGGFAIVLPSHDSVEVTEAVLRVASGADSYVPISKVQNLSRALESAKKSGFWVGGAVVENGKSLYETPLPFPFSLVIGSEQKGIREGLRKHLDILLTIPASSRLPLNVAAAAAIFCYEISRQKNEIKNKK